MRLRLAATALVAVVGLTACPPPGKPVALPVSVVIGDSIATKFSPVGIGWIDASHSRTTWSPGRGPSASGTGYEATLKAARIVAPGKWVIIELGTNDVTNPEWQMAFRVQQLVDAVPNDRCIAFVTPHRTAAVYQQRLRTWIAEVRKRITQRTCRWTIEWRDHALTTPGMMDPDGIHPSAAGTAWLQDQMRRVAAKPYGTNV